MSLVIESFSVEYAGTYPMNGEEGTKINMKFIANILKPIVLTRQSEWCDGKEVMNYLYPPDQPISEPGEYVKEETDYMHIPWVLEFKPMGHNYEIEFEYRVMETGEIETARASAIFYVPGPLGFWSFSILTKIRTKIRNLLPFSF